MTATHVEVLQGGGREDVDDLHHVLVVEVSQQPDLPHDALRVHQVVEGPGNFLDRYLQTCMGHKLLSLLLLSNKPRALPLRTVRVSARRKGNFPTLAFSTYSCSDSTHEINRRARCLVLGK